MVVYHVSVFGGAHHFDIRLTFTSECQSQCGESEKNHLILYEHGLQVLVQASTIKLFCLKKNDDQNNHGFLRTTQNVSKFVKFQLHR